MLAKREDLRVELRGFEPLTPSMRTRCATGLRYSPKTGSQRTKHRARSTPAQPAATDDPTGDPPPHTSRGLGSLDARSGGAKAVIRAAIPLGPTGSRRSEDESRRAATIP